MTGSAAQQPAEGRLADWLSQPGDDAATTRMRVVTLLRRLDSYDRAVYRSVAQLHVPLLDEPLRLVSDFANFSKPWFLISGALALFGGTSGQACRAHRTRRHRRGIPGGEPAHEDGRCTHPPRPGGRRGTAAAVGAYAVLDVVPLRSLRLRCRLRSCRRRRPPGTPAAIGRSSLGRGVLPRVYRRALPR